MTIDNSTPGLVERATSAMPGLQTPDPIQYVPDVAERLRTTEPAVRWLVYTGQLPPHIKIGNRLAWKASQIEAYLDAKFAEAEKSTNTHPAA